MLTFDPPVGAVWPDSAAEGAKAAMQQLGKDALHGLASAEQQMPAYVPRNITYVDAVLTALDAPQVAAAHDAAQRVKATVLEHNVKVASQFLANTAQLKMHAPSRM